MSISRYTVDSVLEILDDDQTFDLTIDQQMFGPNYGPMFLNTSIFENVFPGIQALFGDNQPMSIEILSKRAPQSSFKQG